MAATRSNRSLIGKRYTDGQHTFEVLHWSQRRPGLCEVRVLAAPQGHCLAVGAQAWPTVRSVRAALAH